MLPAGLAACASDAESGSSGGRLRVEASFYPLEFVTERVGGDHVEVRNLTRPGAEPHDLTLSPREVGAVSEADLVVYLEGFQAAVDEAVVEAGGRAFDVAAAARLEPLETGEHGHGHEGEGEGEGDGHDGHDGHDHGPLDPHFWLDPDRLGDVAEAVRDRLIELDSSHAADYRANTAGLLDDLDGLTGRYERVLANCERREIVTTHAAFGYLAGRFDLHQEPITGLSPTSDPSGEQLARAARFVRAHDVQTIYFETLVSPSIAEAVADETGAKTAVLDPVEGLSKASEGDDYLSVMRSNLDNLRTGLGCR